MKKKTLNTIVVLLSLVLYALSLTQTAYCAGDCTSGIGALLLGPLGIMVEVSNLLSYVLDTISGSSVEFTNPIGATFIWLANPLWLLALVLFVINKKTSLIFSIISLLTMLTFLACSNVIQSNESGGYTAIAYIGPGYWLWVLSAAVIALAAIAAIQLYKNSTG